MKTMEISGKELVVSKIEVNQLFDQLAQIKKGLLFALDAVECACRSCAELKDKHKQHEEVN
jgi:hypothetical protein